MLITTNYPATYRFSSRSELAYSQALWYVWGREDVTLQNLHAFAFAQHVRALTEDFYRDVRIPGQSVGLESITPMFVRWASRVSLVKADVPATGTQPCALSARANIGDLYWMLLPNDAAVGPRVNYTKTGA